MAAQSSLPHRGTGMSDDAVPDTDPSDVRVPLCDLLCDLTCLTLVANRIPDFKDLTRAPSSIQTCCRLLGGLHLYNREDAKDTCKGI